MNSEIHKKSIIYLKIKTLTLAIVQSVFHALYRKKQVNPKLRIKEIKIWT